MSDAAPWVAALVAGVLDDVRTEWDSDAAGLDTPVAIRDEIRRRMLDVGVDALVHVSYGDDDDGATTLRLMAWSEHDVRGASPGVGA